ncbi:Ribosome production factor 2 [Amphibalanus amphitrite]|uniref:Ribosome production factor 2 homolog n=1 Tax=Amphibalanus amphitrite TaxID=1232801 RepID=A0A6A4XAW4_AMPAM|nr:ribosome production factor 2 homolog isoform X1 [Amphibalanus amphitrite]KAF0311502.1 Ribosome production factor 2 [Amphibalanus amphitrite]
MGVKGRIEKTKTRKGKKHLESRAPKLIENEKKLMLLKGHKTNAVLQECLKDLASLKRPHSILLNRKRDLLPFEDITPVEQLAAKMDASLFAIGSHSKKRPQNLVLGRMFDHHLLDMIELGVQNARALHDFKNAKVAAGTKPCLLFAGEPFKDNDTYVRLKSLLIDFFRGEQATAVRRAGFEHALSFTASQEGVHMRSYRVTTQRAGGQTPRVELEEIGPSLDLVLRRHRLASDDLFRRALKQPKELKTKKVKNISDGKLGAQMGRIHMEKQDLRKINTRKLKGLKTGRDAALAAAERKQAEEVAG